MSAIGGGVYTSTPLLSRPLLIVGITCLNVVNVKAAVFSATIQGRSLLILDVSIVDIYNEKVLRHPLYLFTFVR